MDITSIRDSLNNHAEKPIYRQLSDALRDQIIAGALVPGGLLPSSRQLADDLNIARLTVIRGYEELISQGYLTVKPGQGTYVSSNLPPHHHGKLPSLEEDLPPSGLRLSSYGWHLLQKEGADYHSTSFPQLNWGAPPPECLPIKQWRALIQRHSRAEAMAEIDYATEPFGFPPLRAELAKLLNRRRSIICDPEQIILFGGAQHALNMISRILVDQGAAVVLEESGFSDARHALLAQGARIYPLPVDESGLVVTALNAIEEELRLVYVCPSHHNPSGVALAPERRRMVLDFASRTGTFVVEDDYDNEFRYAAAPVAALYSEDTADCVIYSANFWRVLYPLVSLHFCVIPKKLVPVFERAKALSQRTFAMIEQYVLTDFIGEGHLEVHIRRLRTVYARRRQRLIKALTECFRQKVIISKHGSGLHLNVRFVPEMYSGRDVEACAESVGLPLVSTRAFYLQNEKQGEFIVGFGIMEDELIEETVRHFAACLEAGDHEI